MTKPIDRSDSNAATNRSARRRISRTVLATSALAITAAACTMAPPVDLGPVGPSTSTSPYLLPVADGVKSTSILTTGDAVEGSGYRMAGIPDGLGVFDNLDGTMTVLMNHELGGTVGVTRAHGAKGAFISKWVIRKSDLKVLSGSDLINGVAKWN